MVRFPRPVKGAVLRQQRDRVSHCAARRVRAQDLDGRRRALLVAAAHVLPAARPLPQPPRRPRLVAPARALAQPARPARLLPAPALELLVRRLHGHGLGPPGHHLAALELQQRRSGAGGRRLGGGGAGHGAGVGGRAALGQVGRQQQQLVRRQLQALELSGCSAAQDVHQFVGWVWRRRRESVLAGV